MNRDGSRRLDDPPDFVRREVAAAFRGGGLVVPILAGGASMPDAVHFPHDLAPLASRNAVQLNGVRRRTM